MEAMERRCRFAAIAAVFFIIFSSQCGSVEGQRNNTKMSYVCPPNFIRLGHSCYFFSENKDSWHNALFACTDRDSNLTVPARWEDRNLRKYLNKPDIKKVSRWIGGIYDYGAKSWRWGGDLHRMHYQSFSKMKKMSPEELEFHCIAMLPELLYRWSPRSCTETRHFICQTKLRKVPKDKVKDLRRRWQRMGEINEITAPSVSREVNNPLMMNDVTINPVNKLKSYDVRPNQPGPDLKRHGSRNYNQRPNEMKKRQRPSIRRRLKRPFPGYTWNRRDPEGSYQRNAALLRSGRTHLTPQQVKTHLARLQHLRDKQISRRKRLHDDDWLENEPRKTLARMHARTYTIDNNISALHPKTIVEEFNMDFPQQPIVLPQAKHNNG